jgi:hypothetical protein
MGALPAIKRFLVDDFPEQASWIGTLLYPLNLLLNTVYSNLNNGITIAQNLTAQINTLAITGSSPTTTFNWKFSGSGAPSLVQIGNIKLPNGSIPTLTAAVMVLWSYDSGVVTVSLVGLPNNSTSYNVTFVTYIG